MSKQSQHPNTPRHWGEHRSSPVRRFVAGAALAVSMLTAHSQNTATAAQGIITIHGTVKDAENHPVADASIQLELKSTHTAVEVKSDANGAFTISAVATGTYAITATKAMQRSASVELIASTAVQQEPVTLVLKPSNSAAQQSMQFADEPSFVVAGVTDWTAIGGHGSDAILRTSETLSRDTLSLKPDQPAATAPADLIDAQARTLIDANQLPQALDQLHKSIAKKPTADTLRLAGEVDEKLGDPLTAVHEFEQAAGLDPSEQNYFAWGSELLLHRAVWQAQQVFTEAAKAYPTSARIETALGTALFASAHYDEAALHLCHASELAPQDPDAYSFMGKIELAAPNPLPCVEQKLAGYAHAHPENSLASYYYAMALWKPQGQLSSPQTLQQVESLLTQAVNADPKCADGYLQLGILALTQHNLPKAIDFYNRAIGANPQLGDAHYRLGVAYDRLGQSEKARHEFDLHAELLRQQADAIERERKDVKQFQVVLQNQPSATRSN